MKLINMEVKNFGSFKHLKLDLSSPGMTLLSGPTGSGKSTIQDMAFWILCGETTKNTGVNSVKNWNSEGSNTEGVLYLELNGKFITVARIRGYASKDNDLYWIENENRVSGKDLVDTQQLLLKRLELTTEQMNIFSIYNEFSLSASFFTNNVKQRKEFIDNLIDASLQTKISNKLVEERSRLKVTLVSLGLKSQKSSYAISEYTDRIAAIESEIESWAKRRDAKLNEYKKKQLKFNEDKISRIESIKLKQLESISASKIETLSHSMLSLPTLTMEIRLLTEDLAEIEHSIKELKSEICEHCGSTTSKHKTDLNNKRFNILNLLSKKEALKNKVISDNLELKRIKSMEREFSSKIQFIQMETNKYDALILSLKDEQPQFQSYLARSKEQLKSEESTFNMIQKDMVPISMSILHLDQLEDIISEFRKYLISQTVSDIENKMNYYLDHYFGAEFKLAMSVQDHSSIKLTIAYNGIECDFKQLSKGQRALIKLCFGSSVLTLKMRPFDINIVFFDEALDGMDVALKVKSFRLFQDLALEIPSIIISDHDTEFQSYFSKRLSVERIDGYSVVTEL